MKAQIKKPSFYILAGGKSSRMGEDKGLMLISNKPVVQFIIEQLQLINQNISIVSNNPEYNQFGLEVLPDLIKNIGPAGGIYTALQHSQNEYNFIISCDMPMIISDTVKFILEHSESAQIILPVHQEKIEPLFGVYNKTCLQVWKQLIESGLTKIQTMITHFEVLKLNADNNKLFSENLFTNLNTREDFEKLLNSRILK